MPIEEIVLSSTVDFSPSLFGWSRDVEVDLNLLGMRIHVRLVVRNGPKSIVCRYS